MENIKKILFFGLGSIGTRHLKLLKKNYDFEIYAYRSKKENPINDIVNIYNLNEALQVNPDIVFITNPTHLHIKTAISCLKAGITNIFIEKPLSNTLDDLDIFLRETERIGALVYIGYNMRYSPILIRLKNLVKKREKSIFYAETLCSSFLPSWRSERDYRETYSSKKEQGGGVILDLSHEFDYNEWLFGKIKSINGVYGKISKLDINSEDMCDVIVRFEKKMIAKIHLNYFGHKDERLVKIFTPSEEIIADLINKEIIIINEQGKKIETFSFELNYLYEQQQKYFLDGVETQSKEISNLKDAKELLVKLLDFKKNNKMIMTSNNLKD